MKQRKKVIVAVSVFLVLATVFLGYYVLLRRSPGTFFEHNGARLFYSDAGKGEPVLLLHGFGVNGDLNWRLTGIAPELRKEFRVIALDQRGCGLSSKPGNPAAYGVEMAHDVVRLMDHLRIRKAHVAGYSLGGYVALKVAALYPDRLLSVACLGAGWQDPDDPRAEEAFNAFGRLADQLESGRGVEPVATTFGEGDHQTTAWHRMQVKLATSLLGDKKALAAMLRGARGLAVQREDLVAIKTPMLIVCGERDPNYTSAVKLHEALPSSTFVSAAGRSHPATAMSSELRNALLTFIHEHPDKSIGEARP